jgi:hypothetical protein
MSLVVANYFLDSTIAVRRLRNRNFTTAAKHEPIRAPAQDSLRNWYHSHDITAQLEPLSERSQVTVTVTYARGSRKLYTRRHSKEPKQVLAILQQESTGNTE